MLRPTWVPTEGATQSGTLAGQSDPDWWCRFDLSRIRPAGNAGIEIGSPLFRSRSPPAFPSRAERRRRSTPEPRIHAQGLGGSGAAPADQVSDHQGQTPHGQDSSGAANGPSQTTKLWFGILNSTQCPLGIRSRVGARWRLDAVAGHCNTLLCLAFNEANTDPYPARVPEPH